MGRISVIAITQFVFLALGLMALTVLVNAGAVGSSPGQSLALFLKQNGLWLLLVPIGWALYANIASRVNKGLLLVNIAVGIGCVLAVGIFLVFALAIF